MTILVNQQITAPLNAVAGNVLQFSEAIPEAISLQASFIFGSGGATADVWVQTTFDGGVTWMDVANFHFLLASAIALFNLTSLLGVTTAATPGDGVLAANTSVNGFLGPRWRTKITTTGTYVGTSVRVDANAVGRSRLTSLAA